jgi:transcriptional regulator with XRE-family HTH domain
MRTAKIRAYSRYGQDAAVLLGRLIRAARIARKLTVAGVAERAGISRGLVQRIEKGDPGCAIGAAFEVAAIAGVPLFDAGNAVSLSQQLATNEQMLTLLPKRARAPTTAVKDDF